VIGVSGQQPAHESAEDPRAGLGLGSVVFRRTPSGPIQKTLTVAASLTVRLPLRVAPCQYAA